MRRACVDKVMSKHLIFNSIDGLQPFILDLIAVITTAGRHTRPCNRIGQRIPHGQVCISQLCANSARSARLLLNFSHDKLIWRFVSPQVRETADLGICEKTGNVAFTIQRTLKFKTPIFFYNIRKKKAAV